MKEVRAAPPTDKRWLYEEAINAPIFFELYVCSTKQSRAKERAGEKLAIEWAKRGLKRVEHLLDETGQKLMGSRAFQARYPGLRGSRKQLSEIVKAIPKGQKEAISKGYQQLKPGEWVWHEERARVGKVTYKWADALVIDLYREDQKGRLKGTGEKVKAVDADLQRCVVRSTLEDPKQEDGPFKHEYDGLYRGNTPYAQVSVGVRRCPGLGAGTAISMASLTVRDVKAVRAAKEWECPRTFRAGGAHERAGQSKEATARAFRLARRKVLPQYLREIRYKVLVSGFLIGKGKCASRPHCVHCDQANRVATRCQRKGFEETVAHVFAECPLAQALWRRVFKAWERATGERLDPKDQNVTLRGDRRREHEHHGEARTSYEQLEEPFSILHAETLRALWKQRCALRNGEETKTTIALHSAIRKEMLAMADARLAQCISMQERDAKSAEQGGEDAVDTFMHRWVHSGLCEQACRGTMLVRSKRAARQQVAQQKVHKQQRQKQQQQQQQPSSQRRS